MNLLFICSKNQWRSPTAEQIFRRDAELNVRSKGTSRSARRTVTARDIEWADLVLVMENKHKKRLLADYPDEMDSAEVHVLDIPDDYQFMHPELVELLHSSVHPLLERAKQAGIPEYVAVGNLSKQELLTALSDGNVQLNQAALDLFADVRFQPSDQVAGIQIESHSVASLGLTNGATYSEIVARASELQLAECPLELAAYMRLQYLEQPIAAEQDPNCEPGSPPGALTVASAPFDVSDAVPKGFYLRNINGTLWLRGYWSDAQHVWNESDVFVFAVADSRDLH